MCREKQSKRYQDWPVENRYHAHQCKEWRLQTLEERGDMLDIMLVYKFQSGHGNLRSEQLFEKIDERMGPRTSFKGIVSRDSVSTKTIDM
jgi:hypothetical protein